MIIRPTWKCNGCRRPAADRLALLQARDDYECYAESYIKCFWGLCDLHKSTDNFIAPIEHKVITTQPVAREMPCRGS